MPDYSLGKIYKIECLTSKLIYYGSTCEPTLARRLSAHRNLFNLYKKTGNKFMTSFLVLLNDNYEITLVESFPCKSRDELMARERYHTKINQSVNYMNSSDTVLSKSIISQFKEGYPKSATKGYTKGYTKINYTQEDVDNMIEINTRNRERIVV